MSLPMLFECCFLTEAAMRQKGEVKNSKKNPNLTLQAATYCIFWLLFIIGNVLIYLRDIWLSLIKVISKNLHGMHHLTCVLFFCFLGEGGMGEERKEKKKPKLPSVCLKKYCVLFEIKAVTDKF